MSKLTKKQKLLAEKLDAEKLYGFDEALALLQARSPARSSTRPSKWR